MKKSSKFLALSEYLSSEGMGYVQFIFV